MQKIALFLWFDSKAEEAIPQSQHLAVTRIPIRAASRCCNEQWRER